MTIKDKLTQDLKVAMKAGDSLKKETVRLLRSAIRNAEIDVGHDLNDDESLAILSKQAKQRRDSIAQYRQAGRDDLADHEADELTIIEAYLPRQLTDDEIVERAKAAIAELGVAGMAGMGPAMKRLSAELKGQADGKRISQVVRSLLS